MNFLIYFLKNSIRFFIVVAVLLLMSIYSSYAVDWTYEVAFFGVFFIMQLGWCAYRYKKEARA